MSEQFKSQEALLQEINRLQGRVAALEAEKASHRTDRSSEFAEQYRRLFEQAGDSIFIIDTGTFHIIDVNANAARRLGFTVEELRDVDYREIEIMEPSEVEASNGFSWRSTVSGMFVYETTHRRKDHTTMPVEVSSSIVRMDGHEVIQNVVRDLTKRRLAEQSERDMLVERERVKLLSSFIEQASHEFRTPLSIIGTRSFLLEKSDDIEKRTHHRQIITEQVDHVSRLVDGLITLSHLAKGNNVTRIKTDISQLTRMVIEHQRNALNTKDIAITSKANFDGPCIIIANEEYLIKALTHLVLNAIQNSTAQGEIVVHMSKGSEAITIEIHDNGKGISPEHLPYIFDTFYRVDMVGTTRGLGLGLAIVRMIVEMHQGRIEVESEAGKGSVFRVVLPLAR